MLLYMGWHSNCFVSFKVAALSSLAASTWVRAQWRAHSPAKFIYEKSQSSLQRWQALFWVCTTVINEAPGLVKYSNFIACICVYSNINFICWRFWPTLIHLFEKQTSFGFVSSNTIIVTCVKNAYVYMCVLPCEWSAETIIVVAGWPETNDWEEVGETSVPWGVVMTRPAEHKETKMTSVTKQEIIWHHTSEHPQCKNK